MLFPALLVAGLHIPSKQNNVVGGGIFFGDIDVMLYDKNTYRSGTFFIVYINRTLF